jgi:eukaryotic-like serine/threonine-protein kinase
MNKIFPWIVILAIAAGAYFSFEWAIGAAIHNRKVVQVPDISGKNLNDALSLLSPLHLGLSKEGEQYDKSFPAGTIVRQNPPKDMSVREGRIIRVTLSQGGESLFVPDLVGQPLRNAQMMLQNAGLNLGEIDRRPSLRFEKDMVMSTDPPGSQAVSKNALVNIIVSGGQPGAEVVLTPDFVGKNISEAKSWAAQHQVNVETREEADPFHAQGDVINQAPAADASIRLGETLTLVVNSAAGGGPPHIRYQLPQGDSDRDVRVVIIDSSGEREVFRKTQAPGTEVDVPAPVHGRGRARIFVNGVMAQEQQIQ